MRMGETELPVSRIRSVATPGAKPPKIVTVRL
jgi:hypothetical protein